ncbi:MAG TPA: hypothetical protein PKW59_09755 [Thermotogota bacterium]|nr:hypothetical protein [Thermotogota bacterium]HPM21619.1 hypothetical protein [Thermotogota bacterium]
MAYKSKQKVKQIPEPEAEPTTIIPEPIPEPEPEPEFYTLVITKNCRDSIMRYQKGKEYLVTPEVRAVLLGAGVARDKSRAH